MLTPDVYPSGGNESVGENIAWPDVVAKVESHLIAAHKGAQPTMIQVRSAHQDDEKWKVKVSYQVKSGLDEKLFGADLTLDGTGELLDFHSELNIAGMRQATVPVFRGRGT